MHLISDGTPADPVHITLAGSPAHERPGHVILKFDRDREWKRNSPSSIHWSLFGGGGRRGPLDLKVEKVVILLIQTLTIQPTLM